jgi:hypothetical protein
MVSNIVASGVSYDIISCIPIGWAIHNGTLTIAYTRQSIERVTISPHDDDTTYMIILY